MVTCFLNIETKILEVCNCVSRYRCRSNEIVNNLSILNNPLHSGSGILRRIRDFAFEDNFPTSTFCLLTPFVYNYCLCLSLCGSSVFRDWHCRFCTMGELSTATEVFQMPAGSDLGAATKFDAALGIVCAARAHLQIVEDD